MNRPFRASVLAGLALLGLASCDMTEAPVASPAPRPRPAAAPPPTPSADSRAMAAHYAEVQSELRERGLLRDDGGGADTPVSHRMLVENFIRIALYDEYVTQSGMLVAEQTRSRLRRWEQPIRMGVVFGDAVAPAQRREDMDNVTEYARRLSRLTGLPIRMTEPEAANFHVLILNEDERRAFGPRLRRLVPGIDRTAELTITGMSRSTFCLVFAFSQGQSSTYSRAVAMIRAEHPDLLRLSCLHEELAQGMGLANDSPAARPSIFNDDEEFGLLTRHDELLLRILYDRRLRPGMTEAQARPIVEEIVDELLGGES